MLDRDISENITRRDFHILRYLIDGAETFSHIQEHLKSIKEKLPDQEHKIMSYEMSFTHLCKKLTGLRKAELITSKRYRKLRGEPGVFSLYALTPQGLGELLKSNLKIEYCRMHFPGRFTVSHDMQVVSVIRKIRQEMIDNELPHLMEDENDIKRKSKGRKKALPDLHIKIIFPMPGGKAKPQDIAIEIDNNTLPTMRVAEKVHIIYKDKGWPTLLLCWKLQRKQDLLKRYSLILQSEIKTAKLKQASGEAIQKIMAKFNRFYVADLYDFMKNGLLGTTWEKADGSTAVLVAQEKHKTS